MYLNTIDKINLKNILDFLAQHPKSEAIFKKEQTLGMARQLPFPSSYKDYMIELEARPFDTTDLQKEGHLIKSKTEAMIYLILISQLYLNMNSMVHFLRELAYLIL